MGQSGEEYLAKDPATRTGYPQNRLLYPADMTRHGDHQSLARWLVCLLISLATVLGTTAYDFISDAWKMRVRSGGKPMVKTPERKL